MLRVIQFLCVSQSFYCTEKTFGGDLLQESMRKGDINHVMYDILKMVEYKMQIITYSQKFRNFTYACYANCARCTNSAFVGQRYRCVNCIALFKTTCAPLLQTKVTHPLRQYFTLSDSLPTVKSNTIFC